ncbi:MAG: Ig-like domain-containing protein, partial [Verrucomicrobiales bacterium]
MHLYRSAVWSAVLIGLSAPGYSVEYGNLDVVQNNNTNNNLDSDDPAVSVVVASGSSANFNFANANRGDIDMDFGTGNDPAFGAIITSVRENGRDNDDSGDSVGVRYVTPLSAIGGDTYFFIPLETAPFSEEWNIDTAAAFFPFREGWLAGHTAPSSGSNGGLQDLVTASPGITFGSTFVDNGGGDFTLDLTGMTSFGFPATSQDGVLLVTGQKNEDNYALSRDNEDGTFTVILKDNGDNDTGSERDPISFAYVAAGQAGANLVAAVGRVQNDGSSEVSGGNYTVTKLRGPIGAGGEEEVAGSITTGTLEVNAVIQVAAEMTDGSTDIIVSDATGIVVGQEVTGSGIQADTTVVAVDGTTVTLNVEAIATDVAAELTFTGTEADEDVVVVADATDLAVGQLVSGVGIPDGTSVVAIDGTSISLSQSVTEAGTDVELVFSTQGRWLLEIEGQDVSSGALILTPCTGGLKNLDNIVSYEWNGDLGVAGGWVVESRDIISTSVNPELEDGAVDDEDMFSFVFFTTNPLNPQPTVSIVSPSNLSSVELGSSVTVVADAVDTAPGVVTQVEFYVDGALVATDTSAPFEYTMPSYSSPQNFEVYAVASDDSGARVSSAISSFSLVPAGGSGGLFFDGLDDYIDLGNPAELNLSTFTLETRFQRSGEGIATTTGTEGVTAIPLVTKGRDEGDQSSSDINYFLGIRES